MYPEHTSKNDEKAEKLLSTAKFDARFQLCNQDKYDLLTAIIIMRNGSAIHFVALKFKIVFQVLVIDNLRYICSSCTCNTI
jgi:hypothetical protein